MTPHTDRMNTYKAFHLFCGMGGGAKGFQRAHARVGRVHGRFQNIGAIDVDPRAVEDYQRLTGSPATCLDLFAREDYEAFHKAAPPSDWREATPADVRAAAGGQCPDVVFLSAPCKGFSGIINTKTATSAKYQALNRLTVRGIHLMLAAFEDDLPALIVFENVPRIQNRGRALLDEIVQVLKSFGYAVAETTHNCGELGGMAQSRNRFLLVARNLNKITNFLYEPDTKPMRSIGEVIGDLPVPGTVDQAMHMTPELQWRTWVRLALIEAGSDWRSLEGLTIANGMVEDYRLAPSVAYHGGCMGVKAWNDTMGTVTGRAGATNGAFAVSDPRINAKISPATGRTNCYGQYGVVPWDSSMGTLNSNQHPGQGHYTVADPRIRRAGGTRPHNNVWRVIPWSGSAQAITAGRTPTSGGQAVADPREAPTGAVAPFRDRQKCRPVIISTDDTWHRPLTTLEAAALQGYPTQGLVMVGHDTDRRERIGNSVPPPAAEAIATAMLETLVLADAGTTFMLSARPIWVHPVATAVALATA